MKTKDIIESYRPATNLLNEKVILVTGSTGGIGKACVHKLVDHGATLILQGKNLSRLEHLYDEIVAKTNGSHAAIPIDLLSAQKDEYAQMATVIEREFGRLDGIIHSAIHLEKLSELRFQDWDEWNRTLRVNLLAPFAITQSCLPLLEESPRASIVYTSETHAHQPSAFWGIFAISIGGVEALSQIQAQEVSSSKKNLRFNVVVPGPINSSIRQRTHPGEDRKKLLSTSDIANAYLYLIGPDSQNLNGEKIVI